MTRPASSHLRRSAGLLLLPVLGWLAIRHFTSRSNPPPNLGLQNGRLGECPDSPNCVQSESPPPAPFIEPFRPKEPIDQAWTRLQATLSQWPRTRLVRQESHYLHYVYTSTVFGFPDDVEFRRSDADAVIHVRSASRIGHSDLGANRRRIETLRNQLGW